MEKFGVEVLEIFVFFFLFREVWIVVLEKLIEECEKIIVECRG